jgi:hypothetical protein
VEEEGGIDEENAKRGSALRERKKGIYIQQRGRTSTKLKEEKKRKASPPRREDKTVVHRCLLPVCSLRRSQLATPLRPPPPSLVLAELRPVLQASYRLKQRLTQVDGETGVDLTEG